MWRARTLDNMLDGQRTLASGESRGSARQHSLPKRRVATALIILPMLSFAVYAASRVQVPFRVPGPIVESGRTGVWAPAIIATVLATVGAIWVGHLAYKLLSTKYWWVPVANCLAILLVATFVISGGQPAF